MKIKDLLLKNQKYLLIVALLLSSMAISIKKSNGQINLLLQEYPSIIFIMIVLSSFLVAIYFRLNQDKITNLSNQILEKSKSKSESQNDLINELTDRQREVYNLIISGKTNKEIMKELFIELSTLKTHINQIYKKLNIQNRKDIKLKH